MKRTLELLAAATLFTIAALSPALAADTIGVTPAGAASLDGERGRITLPAAREAALAASQTVKQAELAVRTGRLDERTARVDFLPSASASSGLSAPIGGEEDFYATPSVGVSAKATLYSGGARTAALKSAKIGTNAAEAALEAARLSVLAEADTRYLDALETEKNHEAAIADLAAAEARLELARARKAAGSLAEDEFLEIQSAWSSKKTAAIQAKYAAEASRRKLASLTKTNAAPEPLDDAVFRPLLSVLEPRATADLDGLVGKLYLKARSANSALRQEDLAVALADLSVRAKKAAFFPTVSASFSYSASKPDGESFSGDSSAIISASIPIFPLTDTAVAVSAAKAGAEKQRSILAAAEEELLLSLYTTTLDLLSASHRIQSADDAVAYAEENHRMVLEKVRLSVLALTDLSDADATLTTARKEAISARFDLYASALELARLLGEEDTDAVSEALEK